MLPEKLKKGDLVESSLHGPGIIINHTINKKKYFILYPNGKRLWCLHYLLKRAS